jgi:hypothetical protein
MAATAEKAQHEPHCPWFFTPVTFPEVVQSTSPTIGVWAMVSIGLAGTFNVR